MSSRTWKADAHAGGSDITWIGTPLIVHACHCRWCQRETAHALNALYEADRVVHTAGELEIVVTIARCPDLPGCGLEQLPAIRSRRRFVRVTMDNRDLCPPDIHIYRPPSSLG
jgi:hypothetical protein